MSGGRCVGVPLWRDWVRRRSRGNRSRPEVAPTVQSTAAGNSGASRRKRDVPRETGRSWEQRMFVGTRAKACRCTCSRIDQPQGPTLRHGQIMHRGRTPARSFLLETISRVETCLVRGGSDSGHERSVCPQGGSAAEVDSPSELPTEGLLDVPSRRHCLVRVSTRTLPRGHVPRGAVDTVLKTDARLRGGS